MNLLARIKKIEKEVLNHTYGKVSDQILEERSAYEKSLYKFVQGAWHTIEGSNAFVPGWHLEAISEHLEAALHGQIRKLLINIPRRCCKTTITSNMLCPWGWAALNPELRFLYGSYSVELAVEANIKSRYIIQSDWYQRLWGDRFAISTEVNTQKRFENTLRGFRAVTSVSGGVTGKGANVLVADDPNNVSDMDSEVDRNRTNNWWDRGMSMSLNDPNTGVLIVIQQRLHHDDLTGHLLGDQKSAWTHLCLPMEFEKSRRSFSKPLNWSDPRQKEGELLWPNRIHGELVEEMKMKLRYSEYLIAGQLQQRPTPEEGGIFKRNWFKVYKDDYPSFKFILQSWDTALIGQTNTKADNLNCSSACTTWGIWEDEHEVNQIMLLSAWKGMVEFPELYSMAKRLAYNFEDTNLRKPLNKNGPKPHTILIEAKANGDSLAQTLRRLGLNVTRFNPTPFGNKTARARLVSHHAFAGTIWIPTVDENSNRLPQFAEIFLEAATLFPDPSSRDLIDTMSQALIRFGQMGMIYHPDDVKPTKKYPRYEDDEKPLYIDSINSNKTFMEDNPYNSIF